MIKVISPALKHPTNRNLSDFHRYWGESHGPLFAQTKNLRGYIQHLTLHESYETLKPTHDGASMFLYDDDNLDPFQSPTGDPEVLALREAVIADDRQLFDRIPGWPTHHKRASVTATERVIVDGKTTPEMVKAVFIVARMPGLSLEEFSQHWYEVHGPLAAKLPGVRRYVQNHAVPEAYRMGRMSHDGWVEMWFDDLAAIERLAGTPEAQAVAEDGQTLFAQPMCRIYARERIQKLPDVPPKDPGARSLSEAEIEARLRRDGFIALADNPDAIRKIKAAAMSGTLAVWSNEHIVTIDNSRIDARPERLVTA
jgi:uncharacterized protein (TIGR02118 family)